MCCNLPALEAGDCTSRTLRVKLANPEDWTASELLPAVQPDGLTIPASSIEQDSEDGEYALITVQRAQPGS